MSGGPPELVERFARVAREARDALARAGAERWELYAKVSAWRGVTWRAGRPAETVACTETGVAVRTRRRGRSGFAAAAGDDPAVWRSCAAAALAAEHPDPVDPLPPPTLLGTSPVEPGPPRPPTGWARHVAEELAAEISRSGEGRIAPLAVGVREGEAAWVLHASEGFTASHRRASAEIVVEAARRDRRGPVWREVVPVPDPAALEPRAVARTVADRLLLLERPADPPRGVRDLLLDTAAAAALLAEVAALLAAAPPETDALVPLLGRSRRLAAPELTLRDRRERGPAAAPCDGEGLPARTLELIAAGAVHHRPATYGEAAAWGYPPVGGAIRPGYREPPRAGFAALEATGSHPRPPRELLEASPRAVYLLRLVAPPRLDPVTDRVHLAGMGLSLDRGRLAGWHPVVEVRGRLTLLLERIEALGTDHRWHQTAHGLVASPTLLVRSQLVG